MFNRTINTIGFQEPATPVMEGIIDLHNYIFFYLTLILGFVLFIFIDIFIQHIEIFRATTLPVGCEFSPKLRKVFLHLNKVNHATNLEIIWTTIPSIILVFIAIPSLALLYSMDELLQPQLTFKATGYQWYWTYEFSDTFVKEGLLLSFVNNAADEDYLDAEIINKLFTDYRKEEYAHLLIESYILPTEELDMNKHHRLLSTDHIVVLPVETHIRLLVTGADVLHSWAVPSLGVKIDAVPGRLNQVAIYLKKQGTFYGQCSESCGANHAFMPIVVKSVSLNNFFEWLHLSIYSRWSKSLY
jgi:cytochrome c oxidase subunit 2